MNKCYPLSWYLIYTRVNSNYYLLFTIYYLLFTRVITRVFTIYLREYLVVLTQMKSNINIALIAILIVILIAILLYRNNIEHSNFTNVSPVPNYPLSYVQGVRIARKMLDPAYHDSAIYGSPMQDIGPIY